MLVFYLGERFKLVLGKGFDALLIKLSEKIAEYAR